MNNYLACTCLLVFTSGFAKAQVQFQDVSAGSGFEQYVGKSFGSSWGDINGDGLLDFFISKHYNLFSNFSSYDYPFVFINNGDGTFSPEVFEINVDGANDLHSGLFFDFDNDGDTDLLIMTGGTEGNLFFVNDGDQNFTLQNRSLEFNISQTLGRGRMAGCIDIDKNGVVDVILNNLDNDDTSISPPSIYTRQDGEPFVESNTLHGFNETRTEYSTLTDLDNDGEADLFVLAEMLKVYRIATGQFEQMFTYESQRIQDVFVGDVTGDNLPDIYIAHGADAAEIVQYATDEIRSVIVMAGSIPARNFEFNTTDSILISIVPRNPSTANGFLHLGVASTQAYNTDVSIKLHKDDPVLDGFQDLSTTLPGWQVSIGKDQTGKFIVRSGSISSNRRIALSIKGDAPLDDFQADNIPFNANLNKDILLVNQGGFNFIASTHPVFDATDNSRSVVIADFDNDMDLDIYVVCATTATNRPNYLIENTGNGEYLRHSNAWGADGALQGIGDAVTVVDYDNDGFLDLFVSNGLSIHYLEDAPYKLYRNLGNGNNWIKLMLKGSAAPVGGYGAVVYAYAGGVVQSRTQNAGEHNRCQNDPRIHFGLAQNGQVDSLVVRWPCGTVQKLFNVAVNQILEIEEPLCVVSTAGPMTVENNIKLYPNPTASKFYLETQSASIHKLRIVNIAGQVVESLEFPITLNSERIEIKAPDSPGSYMVEVFDKDGKLLARKKLIAY